MEKTFSELLRGDTWGQGIALSKVIISNWESRPSSLDMVKENGI